jgi:hypothetical protein
MSAFWAWFEGAPLSLQLPVALAGGLVGVLLASAAVTPILAGRCARVWASRAPLDTGRARVRQEGASTPEPYRREVAARLRSYCPPARHAATVKRCDPRWVLGVGLLMAKGRDRSPAPETLPPDCWPPERWN